MLHVERRSSSLVVWTVDRPHARNALDHATLDALASAIREAAGDRELRAAILTGASSAFISGGDLRELRTRHSAEDAERLSDAGFAVSAGIAELPFPVIAAIAGPAIGGGAELAVACDMRIADETARIGFRQVRMGVSPAWGIVPRLIALVGAGTATRLLLTAQELGAAECKRLQLVDEVTSAGLACEMAATWASEIALGSPAAVAATKRLLRAALVPAEDVRGLEREVFTATWSGADHRDAVEAYFERRPPRWTTR